MSGKLSEEEIREIIETKGLYYSIRYYLLENSIENEKLQKKINQINVLFDEVHNILYNGEN